MSAVGVTGATGFVGRHLCPLLEHRGHAVRRIVRRAQPPEKTGGPAVVVADMADPAAWAPALAGLDTVIHLIARTHTGTITSTDLPGYRSVNVGITQAVAQAAQDAGVGHLIYVSSIKACGEGDPVAYTEDTPAQPRDVYGQTKLEAEQFLSGLSGDMGVSVIRPPLTYGPGVAGNMARLLRAVHRGMPLPLGLARHPRSVLYVGNLADALELCVRRPPAQGATRLYHVADAVPVSPAQLVAMIASAEGTKPRLLPVPLTLLRLAGRATGRADHAARVTEPLVVDGSRICRELGWSPPHSTRSGLAETVAAQAAARAPSVAP